MNIQRDICRNCEMEYPQNEMVEYRAFLNDIWGTEKDFRLCRTCAIKFKKFGKECQKKYDKERDMREERE